MAKRTPKPNADHVRMGTEPDKRSYAVCDHCGERHYFVLPLPTDTFVKQTKAFVELHRYCPIPIPTTGDPNDQPAESQPRTPPGD